MKTFWVIYGAYLGAFVGSFLACVVYRLPRRIPLGGHSWCDACGTPVGFWVYLPVLNCLLL